MSDMDDELTLPEGFWERLGQTGIRRLDPEALPPPETRAL